VYDVYSVRSPTFSDTMTTCAYILFCGACILHKNGCPLRVNRVKLECTSDFRSFQGSWLHCCNPQPAMYNRNNWRCSGGNQCPLIPLPFTCRSYPNLRNGTSGLWALRDSNQKQRRRSDENSKFNHSHCRTSRLRLFRGSYAKFDKQNANLD
jgi:hypothetical protein